MIICIFDAPGGRKNQMYSFGWKKLPRFCKMCFGNFQFFHLRIQLRFAINGIWDCRTNVIYALYYSRSYFIVYGQMIKRVYFVMEVMGLGPGPGRRLTIKLVSVGLIWTEIGSMWKHWVDMKSIFNLLFLAQRNKIGRSTLNKFMCNVPCEE